MSQMKITFWEFTKRSAQEATRAYFKPLGILSRKRSDRSVRWTVADQQQREQTGSTKRGNSTEWEAAYHLAGHQPSLSSVAISTEAADTVRYVLTHLNERDRNVLKAVFLQDRDKDEVCRELGISRSYMRVLIYRAKDAFRQQYAKGAGLLPEVDLRASKQPSDLPGMKSQGTAIHERHVAPTFVEIGNDYARLGDLLSSEVYRSKAPEMSVATSFSQLLVLLDGNVGL